MLNRPATVYTGEKIKESHMNDLITYYNEIWSGGTYTFDINHNTKNDNRRFGWGQDPVILAPPVQIGKVIEANDMNQAIVQVNAGQYHISDDPTKLLSKLAANHTDPISPVLYNSLVDKVATFENDKYKVDWSDITLDVLSTTNTQTWDNDLECIHKFQFDSYNDARHFFNSGGEFSIELSMAAGGTAGNDTWRRIFEQFDSIRIGAEGCKLVQDEADPKDILSTSTLAPMGFYNGITSDGAWNTILDAGVFRYANGTYEYAYAYVYVYGEYNSRRIRIQLKGEEAGGKFNVYVKVILVEDADDLFPITQPVTLTSGYLVPTTTPLPSDGNASYFTLGSTLYDFEKISTFTPTVTEYVYSDNTRGWKLVDVVPGEQLNTILHIFQNMHDPQITTVSSGTLLDKLTAAEQFRVASFTDATPPVQHTDFDNLIREAFKFKYQEFIDIFDNSDLSNHPDLDSAVANYFGKDFALINDSLANTTYGQSYPETFTNYAEFKSFYTTNKTAIEADITSMKTNITGFTYNTDYLISTIQDFDTLGRVFAREITVKGWTAQTP